MFDNIIGHKETVALLAGQLAQRELPRAVLFFGSAYTGKLSTALEVARGLCCQRGSAEWGCTCPSCERHRLLVHPDLLLLGPRYFDVEMAASADTLRRTAVPAARFLFVRSVRKLLRRFDPALWDADNTDGRKALGQAAGVEDLLESLPPEGAPAERLARGCEAVVEAALKLLDSVRSGGIPIQQIRRLAQWAHLAPGGSHKVAIIENADAINESSRNALLKLLEEPPPGVTLILTTTRRGAIIPTILSRLRPYAFGERPAEEQAEVVRRIFRAEPAEYAARGPATAEPGGGARAATAGRSSLLRDYFRAWRALNPAHLRSLAARFVALLGGAAAPGGGLGELAAELAEGGATPEAFGVFCEALLDELQALLPAAAVGERPAVELPVLERWNALVREAVDYSRLYNPNASLQFEGLFYRMREVA
jgi:DNA polymerase III delta prime subunit